MKKLTFSIGPTDRTARLYRALMLYTNWLSELKSDFNRPHFCCCTSAIILCQQRISLRINQ
jgi:hypothetical protein